MKNDEVWRPLLRKPYLRVALKIAGKLNETALQKWNVLDVCRLALYELWKRAFPDEEFPMDAKILLKRYDADPDIVQSV
jgi:hypothetical protein